MPKYQLTKDPEAIRLFGFDVSALLADGDTVSSFQWTVPDGITAAASVQSGNKLFVKLSGGTKGSCYPCVLEWTTTLGETDQRTLNVLVRER